MTFSGYRGHDRYLSGPPPGGGAKCVHGTCRQWSRDMVERSGPEMARRDSGERLSSQIKNTFGQKVSRRKFKDLDPHAILQGLNRRRSRASGEVTSLFSGKCRFFEGRYLNYRNEKPKQPDLAFSEAAKGLQKIGIGPFSVLMSSL